MANEELNKRVYVKQLKEEFNLEQISGDEQSLQRWIIAPDVNRPGLELTGYLESNDLKRVVVLGHKEHEYMLKLDYQTQVYRFEIITDSYTPCIILSRDFEPMDSLLEVAKRKNFPVFISNEKTYRIVVSLVSFLAEQLAPTTNLYGEMMSIYGKGVMITGKSGIGKSELALDLLNRGHYLVADDRVDVARVHDDILCTAPKILKKMLEIRGIGVVDVTRLFGAPSFLNKCQLHFIIKLVELKDYTDVDRLNPINETVNVLGIEIPQLIIPVTEGKSLSVIIESAVSTYILKQSGFDSNEEFKKRVYESIQVKNEEGVKE